MTLDELLRLVDAFDWSRAEPDAFQQLFERAVALQGNRAALGEFAMDDPRTAQVLEDHAGARIVQLDSVSKDRVKQIIRDAWGEDQPVPLADLGDRIVDAVREQFAGYEDWRADRIARTEMAYAYNMGNVLGWEQTGVELVDVFDGDDFDDECAEANGSVWTVAQALANPLQHPNAVMAACQIQSSARVLGGYRALWRGPVMRLTTARNSLTTVGPNHPMLTPRGWVKAKFLRQGDYVISSLREDRTVSVTDGYFKHRPTPAHEVFSSFGKKFVNRPTVATPDDFHGDGNFCQGQIDVVFEDSFLQRVRQTTVMQQIRQALLKLTDPDLFALSGIRAPDLFASCGSSPSHGGVSRLNMRRIITGRSHHHSRLSDHALKMPAAERRVTQQLCGGFSGRVAPDEVVRVECLPDFVGQAFDFEVANTHVYASDGIITHNCTRDFAPHVE